MNGSTSDSIPTHRCLSQRWVIALAIVLASTALVSTATAQPSDRDRRKQFFEGLFQTLVETQLDRQSTPRPETPRPGTPRPGTPRPKPSPAARQVIQARETVAAFAEESGHVLQALQADAARNPGARALLGDMLRLRADATVLASRARGMSALEPMAASVRSIDRKWRLIHHRLGQMDGLSDTCVQCAAELNAIDLKLCQLFQIQPQIDGRELLRLADALSAELSDMVADIDIELHGARQSQALRIEARRVQQQAHHFSNAIETEQPYKTIVAEFRNFHAAYSTLAAELWPLNNRYLERSMRRIEEMDRAVHTLLWLPQPLNRQHLQHLTVVLTQRVDDLFDAVTLNMLVASPGAANVLNTASQFYGCCEHYASAVSSNDRGPELRAEFQCVQEAWPELAACFRGVHAAEVEHLLKEIDQTFLSMRDALQIQVEFDRRAAIEVVAALEGELEHLALELRHVTRHRSRIPDSFQAQTVQGCEALQAAAGDLHEELIGGRDLEYLQVRASNLLRGWKLYHEQYVNKMTNEDRSHIHARAERIASMIVQLQTMMPY